MFKILFDLKFPCYYCSIDLKKQSEHSGLRPDTSSFVFLSKLKIDKWRKQTTSGLFFQSTVNFQKSFSYFKNLFHSLNEVNIVPKMRKNAGDRIR